jgi:hypothetical protein
MFISDSYVSAAATAASPAAAELVRQLDAAAIDARLHRAFRQPERSAISWYDSSCRSRRTTGRPQRERQRLERLAQLRPQVLVLGLRVRPALVRRRLQLARVDVAGDRLPLLPHAAVVIDAEVAADADDPRLEVRAPVEGASAP